MDIVIGMIVGALLITAGFCFGLVLGYILHQWQQVKEKAEEV